MGRTLYLHRIRCKLSKKQNAFAKCSLRCLLSTQHRQDSLCQKRNLGRRVSLGETWSLWVTEERSIDISVLLKTPLGALLPLLRCEIKVGSSPESYQDQSPTIADLGLHSPWWKADC